MNVKSIVFFCALSLFSFGCDDSKNTDDNKSKEVEDNSKWLSNSLKTGDKPYSLCYNSETTVLPLNSQISVIAPNDCDVLVVLKKNEVVCRHAYITKKSSYTFTIPDGTYQPFFYYGNGWNPNKKMSSTVCDNLMGGFVSDESFSKDSPQFLSGQSLQYTLVLRENGNFSAQSSDPEEAL
jgi:hypothetical protein